MSVIGSNILAGASGQGGGYNLTKSLRFRSSASAYLSRTPASAGNKTTWTYSAWVKRGALAAQTSTAATLLSANSDTASISFSNADHFYYDFQPGATRYLWRTSSVYRDPSAWYHVVFVCDTTNATAANRLRLYINNVQQTFSVDVTGNGYVPQNLALDINSTTAHRIASAITYAYPFDGYLTEVNFIDGQALTPSSFGQTSSTTGVWQPKKYTGTYGTNGFYLPFTDNSTTTTLGNDFSGNGNNWTTNNISLTAGATYDSMTDVPTLTSATQANYCVLNPIDPTGSTASNGNLTGSIVFATNAIMKSTMGMSSGKWYWETTVGSNVPTVGVLVQGTSETYYAGYSSANGISYTYDGAVRRNASTIQTYSSFTNGDVIGIALDMDNGKIFFSKNGTWQGSSDPSAGTNPTASTGISNNTWVSAYGNNIGSTGTINANWGQRPFAYTPPTGFVALNTYNLPTPTIGATASSQANKYMDVTTFTGTGSTQNIVNSGGFQPDFVWGKSRSAAFSHNLYDVLRGATKILVTDATSAEATVSTGLTSFNSNGFTLGTDGNLNGNGQTSVAWQWKANGTPAVTNTAGSITSTVSANTTSGFSVVTYTGNGVASTVGHGLGVAPKMIIVKNRAGVESWRVGHSGLNGGSSPWNYYVNLNTTSAQGASSSVFNNTAPTSSVFSIANDSAINGNGQSHVAYCFSEIAGFSKFGSYTGNGSADGVFLYCGFRPRFIMFKCTSALGHWIMFDSARNTYNVVNNSLRANVSDSENQSYGEYDFTSNGVKIRTTDVGTNGSGSTYIYMAFAENPFKYSLAR